MTVTDLIEQFHEATDEMNRHREAAVEAGKRRAAIAAKLADSGLTYRAVAATVSISEPRAQQLIVAGRAATAA